MDVDREIEELYALPLEGFTRARNDLAKDLAGSGQSEEAARVKKLKKPSIPAWAVNQLARRDSGGIRRLLELVYELRDARSARDIHALSSERRELVARLARTAGELMEEAGHSVSAGAVQRITQTLQAGGEPGEREQLARGVLSAELVATGFDALAGSAEVSFEEAPGRQGALDDAASKEAEQLARAADEAGAEAAELTKAAEEAEGAAARAAEQASEARKRARELREKARKAARHLR